MNRALHPETNNFLDNEQDKLNIVCIGQHPKDASKFILQVLPDNYKIERTLNDLYWLRASLCVEFPFYYVRLADSAHQSRGLQAELHPELL